MAVKIVCTVCSTPVTRGGTTCGRCEAKYHLKCWRYNGEKCARYGCKSRLPKPTPLPKSSFRSTMIYNNRDFIDSGWFAFAFWSIIFIVVIIIAIVVGSHEMADRRDTWRSNIRHQRPVEVRVRKHWKCEFLRHNGYALVTDDRGDHVWRRRED